ncbi:MAG TPA: DUF488 domain-containing protein [Thermodesulfovibrionales bacterium]|nr:DUF488 domain-containing protein [Thermodesulfovibrionales bacterium]
MIKLKRIYDPFSREDGKRVLVDRLWPRGIKKEDAHIDEWLRDIAPSDTLRKWFSHDPSRWEEFKKRYNAELKDKRKLLEELLADSRKGTVTLLFGAKDIERNNAVVIKEALEKK